MTRVGPSFAIVPTDEEERQKKAQTQRTKRLIVIISPIVVAIIAATVALMYVRVWHPAEIDGKAQESAVTAYLEDVERLTHGGIQLDTNDDYAIGTREGSSIQVTLVVGDCSDVAGFVDSPKRPTSKNDIGPLRIEVASTGRFPVYAYPIVHFDQANWRAPLTRDGSSLNHCVSK